MSDELPIGWLRVPVEQLGANEPASLTDGPFGSHLKTSHYTEKGPRVIRLQNIGDGVFQDERAHISESHFDRLRRHEAAAGDVVVAMLGETLPRACVVPSDMGRAIVKADCARLRVHPALTSPRYVAHALNSRQLRSQAAALVHGVGRPRLGLKWLRMLEMPLAPFPEQHRIVAAIESYFTRLDDAVATLERVQRNLKRYRASVLKAAVEGRLVPTEAELARAEGRSYEPASVLLTRILAERRRRWEEAELAKLTAKGKAPKDDKWKAKYVAPVTPDTSELPELPEGWCWASCDQILTRLQTGPFGSSLHRSDYVTGGTPVINPQHLLAYGIHPSDHVTLSRDAAARFSTFRLAVGDVVLGRRGEMGRCALIGAREAGWILGTGSLALRPEQAVDGHFLTWVLRSPRSVRALEGESVGTTMTNLNQEILLGLPIPLAPAAEQSRVAREIERHFSVIDVLDLARTAQRVRLTRLRQSILKWAFEGRLVDQDPADEPASVLLERIRAERESKADAPSRTRVARKNGRRGGRPPADD